MDSCYRSGGACDAGTCACAKRRKKVNPEALGVPTWRIPRVRKPCITRQAGVVWLYGVSGRLLAAYTDEAVAMNDVCAVALKHIREGFART